jgi:hypothetical protein
MYENYLGKDLARTFLDAFKQAGWGDAWLGPGSGLGYGVTTGQGSDTALLIKAAIESTSTLKVEVVRQNEPEWPGLVFLAVGINSNR